MDNLFIGKSATEENAWASTRDKTIPSEGPTLDDLDQDTGSKFVESFNLTMLSDPVDVEELKNIRNEKIERSNKKLSTHSRNTMKG